MRNPPPPSGSSWSSEPQGPVGPERSAHQHEQVWAWPPAAAAQHAPAWAWPPPAGPRRPVGTARPPAGAPYHRLARTRRHRWWRPPLAVGTAVATVVLVQVIIATAAVVAAIVAGVDGTGDDIFRSPLANVVLQLVVIATMAPIVLAAAWLIQRRTVGSVFSVAGRLRVRWLLRCLLPALSALVVSFGVLLGLHRLSSPDAPFVGEYAGGPGFALTIGLFVLLVPFQASAEEIALRGFLMQAVGSIGAGPAESRGARPVSRFLRTPVLGIVISGTVFTLLHDYSDWGLLDVAVFGVAMAWLTWYTGGLEAALGLHVLHNLLAFSITAYEGGLDRVASGSGSWQGVVSTTVEVAVYCALVVWTARRSGLSRFAPEDEPDGDAPGDTGAPDQGVPAQWLEPRADRPGGPDDAPGAWYSASGHPPGSAGVRYRGPSGGSGGSEWTAPGSGG
ncbi:CPBP family intramembrane glutamic endopeptidase [Streptomonospora salina]|uniref:Membrane protease YdiL (CAAX protease family) n=1 Tax=Streptomonospora salina TaxID=104205 RepID=A0A841EEM1_9ACTN|nr:CPBP family intramembrane glutamic endopeptidase [Streptomonospora salina]MBB5999493.1 membrane protease YdiL (CAAX protease family) [Streptomonospora salina]